MSDLMELLTSGNGPLVAAGAVLAAWFFFMRKPEAGSQGLIAWANANKLTIISVLTTMLQNKNQLAGFAATFLANIKGLFVSKVDEPKK